MSECTVIFPHHLFDRHPCVSPQRKIVLVEDERFFSDFRFHRKKLLLHRASLQAYRDRLTREGHAVSYVEFHPGGTRSRLFGLLGKHGIRKVFVAELTDAKLSRQFRGEAARLGIRVQEHVSPGFITPLEQFRELFGRTSHYSMAHFYRWQRKRLGIMVQGGKPVGGKWTYDTANRKRIPLAVEMPRLPTLQQGTYVEEAERYVLASVADHPGHIEDFPYPVTSGDAGRWFEDFLARRLNWFGDYEDAMRKDESFLFHSVISPALNIGLITPGAIIDAVLAYARDHNPRINSLEGFLRQVIGWREFIRGVYVLEGDSERSANFWKHERALPRAFYEGTTGVDPVDVVILRVLKTGYAHHIERLMVLGNFMLLCEVSPDDVYRWFMEMFIDSYDWVMVPNVYGMSQYADGGRMSTKPYICSSNYIRRMSDFSRGRWCDIWDGLYWRFIYKHRETLARNPRLKIMASRLGRSPKGWIQAHVRTAERYLASLD